MLGIRMMMAASGTGGPVSISFTDSSVDVAAATTYNFASQALGTAAGNRKIVVAICAGTSGQVSSVTIGGVSASHVVSVTGSEARTEFWVANVPTGATGTISVSLSASSGRCGIGVWAIYGAGSAAHDTATSTASPGSVSLDVPAGGVAIAACTAQNPVTTTWSGLTENYDENIESGDQSHSGASLAFESAQSGLSITSTYSATPSARSMAAVSFGPG